MTDQVDIFTRSFGTITVDVTISESHNDDVTTTDHPVEQGAAISDHAFKEPAQLTMTVGWSNSSTNAGGDENYAETMYARILSLQEKRELLTVVTGKRTYNDMLLKSVATHTDVESAYALFATLTFRQIIVVETQIVSGTSSDVQSDSKNTSSIANEGTKQASEVTSPTASDLGE